MYACKTDTKTFCEHAGGNLHIEITFPPQTFFPPSVKDEISESLIYQFHEGLLRFDPATLSIHPGIAQHWDVDNTGKVYIFYLDSTAFFHNDPCFPNSRGRQITAHDFVFTFRYLAAPHPENKNFSIVSRILGAKEYFQNYHENPEASIPGIQVVSNFILRIELEAPADIFLFNLAKPAASVLAKEAIKRYGSQSNVGAGPFLFTNSIDNNRVIFTKNERYFKKEHRCTLPYLDSITFTHITNEQERVSLFLDKKLDCLLYIPRQEISQLSQLIPQNNYVLKESFSTIDARYRLYNMIAPNIQNFHTNSFKILELSRVYKN